MKSVLIVKADMSELESTAFKLYKALIELDSNIDWRICSYSELVFYFDRLGPRIHITSLDVDISAFDMVYLRDFRGYEYERNTCALYLKHKGVSFINPDSAIFQHICKLSQYMIMNLNGIHIPSGIYSASPILAEKAARNLGDKVIVKDICGVGGSDNYYISSKDIAETINNSKKKCIVQNFIDNDYDLRITVLGKRIGTVSSRIRSDKNEHRNNIKQGARKEFIPVDSLPNSIKEASIKAANIMGREIAGVDVIAYGDDYAVLEVNLNYGMDGDGVIPPEALSIYDHIKYRLSKEARL
jgi:glutathione synthase/RimK-type ligase-like ATP-grasp enzyme